MIEDCRSLDVIEKMYSHVMFGVSSEVVGLGLFVI